ncbi:uncharacterized protein SCODWIG_00357 [Saccharomycodes ludwigii]|uniref:Uncharacterized protein n=1 Tax=Saccharomycodes ludwigii TaxID=36035 RepID=A0A376B1N4_9ASCO|nr:hypothetical protein SCDLUD_001957 [Saccharomycodes ludwigii]KAH3902144.1 hypothetical protein SCDLUD_001957 [Saccharomycodes ludwigii]SSD58596.1 uncharacterized protein SCODWIG_00357 [Saccharomycodes ludwigii]
MGISIPDSYILPADDNNHTLIKKLTKLPLSDLISLFSRWLLDNENFESDKQEEYDKALYAKNHTLNEDFVYLQQSKKLNTNHIIYKLIQKYFSFNIKMKHLAELDCKILKYSTNESFKWTCSRIINTVLDTSNNGNNPLFYTIDIPKFQQFLMKDFENIHAIHLYSCENFDPELPLILCRIQIFGTLFGPNTSQPVISSSKLPYYIAFRKYQTLHIFSTTINKDDVFSKLILKSLCKSISSDNYGCNYIYLKNYLDIEPTFNLKNLYKYFCTPLQNINGPWLPYLEQKVDPLLNSTGDISPFYIKNKKNIDSHNDSKQTKTIYKFKGILPNNVSNDYLNPEHINYNSVVPVTNVEYYTKHILSDTSTPVNINISLKGKDVFAGLHKLCDDGFIDVERIPNWLCGQNSLSSGYIDENNNFKKLKKSGRLI